MGKIDRNLIYRDIMGIGSYRNHPTIFSMARWEIHERTVWAPKKGSGRYHNELFKWWDFPAKLGELIARG
jgi:hypothetical protein